MPEKKAMQQYWVSVYFYNCACFATCLTVMDGALVGVEDFVEDVGHSTMYQATIQFAGRHSVKIIQIAELCLWNPPSSLRACIMRMTMT
jgi:hypothetical protein